MLDQKNQISIGDIRVGTNANQNAGKIIKNEAPVITSSALKKEDGDYILLESGDKILLEG